MLHKELHEESHQKLHKELYKKEKEILLQAFEAPKPVKKKAFLRNFPSRGQENTLGQLMLSQAGYVRKWVWLVSLLALFGAAILTKTLSDESVWVLSALATCASVSLVAELAKSVSCGMSELEASTKFSLRIILLARMSAIGMVHIVILLLVIPLMGEGTGMEMWRKAVYIAVPYFLTAGLGVGTLRITKHKDGMRICVAVGIGVGMLFPGIQMGILPIYSEQYVGYWTVGALFLVVWFARQLKMTMCATENPA